jgi:C4-dicarboxylate-specific signal transduction histidine kinase
MFLMQNGQPERMTGVSVDITERKQMKLEIEQKRIQLAHVTRVSTMGQLASTLAHELNQPLGAILRNAEAAELFLQDPSPDLDEVRAILADIRKDDQRAGKVIEKVRAMMRQSDVERCQLDLRLLTREAISMIQSDADRRHTNLAVYIDMAMPQIYGDQVQLEQVLINLLMNSLDALDEISLKKRVVTLSTKHIGAMVEVSVCDNGPGISAEKLPHIFEPFFSDKPNGLGMGLAISRGIIEAHGGRLWAKNNELEGATFTFALPVEVGVNAT